MSKPKKSGVDLGGLDSFSAADLMNTSIATQAPEDDKNVIGKIVYLPISILHDDPDNSRTIFDPTEIEGLADSIKAISSRTGKRRGIKEPISVRRHPEIEGEYLINSGHRRKRAALLAGETEAPCFVDDDADDYDNTIVNMKRVGLTAMEVATFIQRRIEAGDSKGDIAKALGQPASYVSDHVLFFEVPEYIRDLYDENICTSMQGLAILHRAAKKNPDAVKDFCVRLEDEIAVAQIRAFVESLKEKNNTSKSTESEHKGADQAAPADQEQGADQAAPADQEQGADQAAPADQEQGADQAAPAGQEQGADQAAPAGQEQGADQAAPAGQSLNETIDGDAYLAELSASEALVFEGLEEAIQKIAPFYKGEVGGSGAEFIQKFIDSVMYGAPVDVSQAHYLDSNNLACLMKVFQCYSRNSSRCMQSLELLAKGK